MATHKETDFDGRDASRARATAASGDAEAEAQWQPLLLLSAIVFGALAILCLKLAIKTRAVTACELFPRPDLTGSDPLEEKLRHLDSILNHKD